MRFLLLSKVGVIINLNCCSKLCDKYNIFLMKQSIQYEIIQYGEYINIGKLERH